MKVSYLDPASTSCWPFALPFPFPRGAGDIAVLTLHAIARADSFIKVAFTGFPPFSYMLDCLFAGAFSISSAITVTASRCAILMPTACSSNDAARMTHGSTGPAHNAASAVTYGTRGCTGGLARGADDSAFLRFTS